MTVPSTLRRLAVALVIALLVPSAARANVPLLQISSDPFTNPTSQHATEVEPDTFAFGSTIVAAFQAGRFVSGGGASCLRWGEAAGGGGGAGAHLGLAYYFYPQADCDVSTCQLDVGFVSSPNGVATWSGATQLAGPMA